LLRIADGLDATHGARVQDVVLRLSPAAAVICCAVAGRAEEERQAALEKGAELFQRVFGRKLVVETT
jgi:hypothetical protein